VYTTLIVGYKILSPYPSYGRQSKLLLLEPIFGSERPFSLLCLTASRDKLRLDVAAKSPSSSADLSGSAELMQTSWLEA
jgi:hypothetical protein